MTNETDKTMGCPQKNVCPFIHASKWSNGGWDFPCGMGCDMRGLTDGVATVAQMISEWRQGTEQCVDLPEEMKAVFDYAFNPQHPEP